MYPRIKIELEELLNLRLGIRPTVLLLKNRSTFQRMVGNNFYVAFAVPDKDLVVIDHSQMRTRPFSLQIILKHELCHLLLHEHVGGPALPKWLDEGICQWASDGIGELLTERGLTPLDQATLSGNYMRIRTLTESFPGDKESLMLAYEESKSLVEYINSTFGREAIRNILAHLKDGDGVEAAVLKSLSIPLDELEARWRDDLGKRTTWFTYVAANLYQILFFLAALITMGGFIRLVRRKRGYEDDPEG
ncbi:MAG: peptidase MA family metallohydrolase [Syntrophobacteria bacterium]